MSARPSTEELVERWLDLDQNPNTRKEITDLVEAREWTELERRLRVPIKFGTAGLRATMEAGFAGMNELTVIQASQGLADYVLEQVPDARERGVVIGHDHRHHSRDFAHLTASVFVHMGFSNVHLYRRLVHTPMVPFAVNKLRAACGIMITASHNPKNDNGYKVYWSNGCQIIPPHDSGIAKCMARAQTPRVWSKDLWAHPSGGGGVTPESMTEELIDSYIQGLRTLCHFEEGNRATDLKYVYTAMHGVGTPFVDMALHVMCLPPATKVTRQCDPDPDFPTVAFPNPEERGALNLAMQVAEDTAIDLVVANDPDADRFAVAERSAATGTWTTFTGDQIGTMLAASLLANARDDDGADVARLAMAASVVSSSMLASMADAEGFSFTQTLTGFKWMANVLLGMQQRDEGHTIPLFAYEEAIGFMVQPGIVNDKDGVSALVAFLELAARQKSQGRSMAEYLDSLYETYGYHETLNHYWICRDPAVIKRLFENLRLRREEPRDSDRYFRRAVFKRDVDGLTLRYPAEVAGVFVTAIRDLTVGFEIQDLDRLLASSDRTIATESSPRRVAPGECEPSLPVSASSEMVTFWLSNGCVFTLRTSGTEPKVKYYIEMKGVDKDAVHDFLEQVVKAIGEDLLLTTENNLE